MNSIPVEEGLAEHSKKYLCRDYFQDQFPGYDFRALLSGKYLDAFDKVERLIAHEGLEKMRDGIRTIRTTTKRPFCRITEEDLAKYFVHKPRILLKELSQPF